MKLFIHVNRFKKMLWKFLNTKSKWAMKGFLNPLNALEI